MYLTNFKYKNSYLVNMSVFRQGASPIMFPISIPPQPALSSPGSKPLGFPEGQLPWFCACLFLFFWSFFLIFRESRREGEREGEKHQCVLASCEPSTGDLAHNPGMCPDLGIEPEISWFLVPRLVLNPLSHTSQGTCLFLKQTFNFTFLFRVSLPDPNLPVAEILEVMQGKLCCLLAFYNFGYFFQINTWPLLSSFQNFILMIFSFLIACA